MIFYLSFMILKQQVVYLDALDPNQHLWWEGCNNILLFCLSSLLGACKLFPPCWLLSPVMQSLQPNILLCVPHVVILVSGDAWCSLLDWQCMPCCILVVCCWAVNLPVALFSLLGQCLLMIWLVYPRYMRDGLPIHTQTASHRCC